jgi:hypothetical protein
MKVVLTLVPAGLVLLAGCGRAPAPAQPTPEAGPPAAAVVEGGGGFIRPGAELATPALTAPPPAELQVAPDSLSWSPDGAILAFGTRDGRFFLADGSGPRALEGAALGGPGRPFVVWAPSGDALLAGGAWFEATTVSTALWLVTLPDGPDSASIDVVVPPSQVISAVAGNTGAVHDAGWSAAGDSFAYTYRAEAWLARRGEAPVRLTTLTEKPLPRPGQTAPFDGVRALEPGPDGALALELSCDCGVPWSGMALLRRAEPGPLVLLHDGLTASGWTPDGRITGQNAYADWTPEATIDQYAAPLDGSPPENLTASNPPYDALRDGPDGPPAPLQTGHVEWGPDGSYLYPLYTYADGPVPHRGFAVRAAGGQVTARPGSAGGWFVAARWLRDGRLAYVEAEPGPAALMVLRRAVVEDGPELELEGLASAAVFSPNGARLAVVESSLSGDDAIRILALESPR